MHDYTLYKYFKQHAVENAQTPDQQLSCDMSWKEAERGKSNYNIINELMNKNNNAWLHIKVSQKEWCKQGIYQQWLPGLKP